MVNFIQLYQLKGWSAAQGKSIVIVPKISGGLSFISSAYIVYDICANPPKRRGPGAFYHKIMLGMSLLDCSSSFFGSFLGSWAMPKGYHYYAVGTQATCDGAAFFHQLGTLGTPLYNCSLMTFLLLQVKYNWTAARIKKVEKWFHIVPWTVCLIVAIAGFPLKVYGPNFMSCWYVHLYFLCNHV